MLMLMVMVMLMVMDDGADGDAYGGGDFVVVVLPNGIFSPSSPFIILIFHAGRREVVQ